MAFALTPCPKYMLIMNISGSQRQLAGGAQAPARMHAVMHANAGPQHCSSDSQADKTVDLDQRRVGTLLALLVPCLALLVPCLALLVCHAWPQRRQVHGPTARTRSGPWAAVPHADITAPHVALACLAYLHGRGA